MGDLLGKIAGSTGYFLAEMVAGTSGRLGILKVNVENAIAATISGTVTVDATGQGDVPITLDGEEVEVTLNGEEVEVTLNNEAVVLGAGSASIGSLGTGTKTIGNIGSVATLPTAVQGPGNPTVDSLNTIAINLAASTANQELVAAPGISSQIWVYGLFMMADTAAGTVALQDEDDTALSGVMGVSDEGGWVLPMSGNFAMPWIKVATNKALEVDTGACTIDGILVYGIISGV
jgi:hypothetical protein